MSPAGNDDPQFIQPPGNLKQKLTSAPKLDKDALDKADQVVADLSGEYLQWVADDLENIQAHYDNLKAGKGDPSEELSEIFRIAHDIKGQGGSFNFHLMTIIGNQLCRFVENRGTPTAADLEVIKVHIDAMRLVIAQRIEGEGGKVGDRLVRGIEAVVNKVESKKQGGGE